MRDAVHGFTFVDPKGEVSNIVYSNVKAAQDAAAFACERPYSYISTPSDWYRAYKQGFRIVRAVLMKSGPLRSAAYQAYQYDGNQTKV